MTHRPGVTVVSGFLGAGKTTLVNRLLSGAGARRVAVLVNDFGAINVDAALIERREAGVIALANGCVCCSLQADLVAQVDAIVRQEPPFEHLVVEASGVSDPGQIRRALGYPRLRDRLGTVAVVTVLDATRHRALSGPPRELADSQLLAADLAVIGKADLATPAECAALAAACTAQGIRTLAAADAPALWAAVLGDAGTQVRGQGTVAPAAEVFEHVALRVPGPLRLRALREVLAALPAEVFRGKGFVRVAELPDADCEVQVVGDHVDLRRATGIGPGLRDTLVFIGLRGRVDWPALEARLAGCGASADGA
ncbi:MAG: GTP-binding protein [Proteobacteria bacterium]|nr:GTP-binding protein [Pseudomonadota bacterium]